MSAPDDLVVVIRLACETEDRDKREQQALLRVAARLDNERNRVTTTQPRSLAEPASQLLLEAAEGQEVSLPKAELDRWARGVERWTRDAPMFHWMRCDSPSFFAALDAVGIVGGFADPKLKNFRVVRVGGKLALRCSLPISVGE